MPAAPTQTSPASQQETEEELGKIFNALVKHVVRHTVIDNWFVAKERAVLRHDDEENTLVRTSVAFLDVMLRDMEDGRTTEMERLGRNLKRSARLPGLKKAQETSVGHVQEACLAVLERPEWRMEKPSFDLTRFEPYSAMIEEETCAEIESLARQLEQCPGMVTVLIGPGASITETVLEQKAASFLTSLKSKVKEVFLSVSKVGTTDTAPDLARQPSVAPPSAPETRLSAPQAEFVRREYPSSPVASPS